MSGFDLSSITGTMQDMSRTTNSMNTLVSSGSRLAGNITGGSTANVASARPVAAAPASAGAGLVAPSGTCIIIPAEASQTNTARFLGKNAYEGLCGMIEGGSTEHLADVLVLDANNKPSALVYDQSPTGGLVLKGTQIPVDIKKDENGQYQAVILSEKEYASVREGMKTKGKGKFSVSSEGNAEDIDNRSWLARNWEWLVGVIVGGLGILGTWLMVRKYKKGEKSAKNEKSSLTSQISGVQKQISDAQKAADAGKDVGVPVSKPPLEVPPAERPIEDSTLAANAILVNVSDTPLNPTEGRSYV